MSKITTVRHKTHGDFGTNAFVSQRLKDILHRPNWNALSDVQKEAVDMICLKLSRIVSGRSDEKDHWVDIGGYAQLAIEEIEAR